ncbi:UNVERIFIED_CONTAM: hypothetical protein HDU68_005624, partial [Siphonaria sp. JEL0065]
MSHIHRHNTLVTYIERSKDPTLAPSRRPMACPVCHMVIARADNMGAHMKRHDPERQRGPRKCPHCPRTFLLVKALEKHVRWHSGTRKCVKCLEEVTVTSEQKVGLGVDFVCRKCMDGIQAVAKEDVFTCGECGDEFMQHILFTRHVKTHDEKKSK